MIALLIIAYLMVGIGLCLDAMPVFSWRIRLNIILFWPILVLAIVMRLLSDIIDRVLFLDR